MGLCSLMPKVNVYLPDRLAEAVRRYEIPLSSTCQEALEREVAARLPFLELTPRARDILIAASKQANRLGVNYVGVEHLVLAVIEEGKSMPAQVIAGLGMTKVLRAALHDAMTAPHLRSNRAVDHAGNVMGYLVGDPPRLVTLDGQGVRLQVDDDGHPYVVDDAGQRHGATAIKDAPLLVSIDDNGDPVIVIDADGHHTGAA